MRRSLVALLVLAAVALGACGGDDDDEETGAGSSTTVATKTTGQAAGTDFCQRAKAFAEEARSVDTNTPEGIQQAYEKAAQSLDALAAIAPDEIKAELERTNAATKRILDELRKVDYDFQKLPPEVQQDMNNPELQEANAKLGAYFTDQCGISQSGPADDSGPPASR